MQHVKSCFDQHSWLSSGLYIILNTGLHNIYSCMPDVYMVRLLHENDGIEVSYVAYPNDLSVRSVCRGGSFCCGIYCTAMYASGQLHLFPRGELIGQRHILPQQAETKVLRHHRSFRLAATLD